MIIDDINTKKEIAFCHLIQSDGSETIVDQKAISHQKRLLLLRDSFDLDNLFGVSKNQRMYPAPSEQPLELTCVVIFGALVPNRCIIFGISSNPVTKLLITILIKRVCFPRFPGGCKPYSSAIFRKLCV
jgi:hypothetical protein